MEQTSKKRPSPPRCDDAFQAGAVLLVMERQRRANEAVDTLKNRQKAGGMRPGSAAHENRDLRHAAANLLTKARGGVALKVKSGSALARSVGKFEANIAQLYAVIVAVEYAYVVFARVQLDVEFSRTVFKGGKIVEIDIVLVVFILASVGNGGGQDTDPRAARLAYAVRFDGHDNGIAVFVLGFIELERFERDFAAYIEGNETLGVGHLARGGLRVLRIGCRPGLASAGGKGKRHCERQHKYKRPFPIHVLPPCHKGGAKLSLPRSFVSINYSKHNAA